MFSHIHQRFIANYATIQLFPNDYLQATQEISGTVWYMRFSTLSHRGAIPNLSLLSPRASPLLCRRKRVFDLEAQNG